MALFAGAKYPIKNLMPGEYMVVLIYNYLIFKHRV